MNIDTLTFCLSQISHLVGNLSKKTYKQYSAEISNVSSNQQIYILNVVNIIHSIFVFDNNK